MEDGGGNAGTEAYLMGAGTATAARSSRFESGGLINVRFEELIKERELKRKLLPASKGPIVGTCQTMCPEFEMLEREVHLDLSPFETMPQDPQQLHQPPRIDPAKAVKKYHRPAAGNEVPLPEDVRPPQVLRLTMDYLVGLLDRVWNESTGDLGQFAQLHKFVRDRTRSIRQDATLQALNLDLVSLRVHQEIARFHILSGHRLCELPKAEFDAFQNTEQLRKVLQSLSEFYTDIRRAHASVVSPSALLPDEGEFRGYYLLTHLEDPDVFRKSFGWTPAVQSSPPVQFALAAGAAFHQTDWIHFFSLLNNAKTMAQQGSLPVGVLYLSCCLLQTHFASLRKRSISVMVKAFAPHPDSIPIDTFAGWLALEDLAELQSIAEATSLVLNRDSLNNIQSVSKPPPGMSILNASDASFPSRRSNRFIEALVAGIPTSHIIRGLTQATPIAPLPPPILPADLQQPGLKIEPKTSNGPFVRIQPQKLLQPDVKRDARPPLKMAVAEVHHQIPVVAPTVVPVKPVKIAEPSRPLFDYDRLARLIFENLSACMIQAFVDTASQQTCQCQVFLNQCSQIVLPTLVNPTVKETVFSIACSAVKEAKRKRAILLELLERGMLMDLFDTVVHQIILEAAEMALYQAYTKKLKASNNNGGRLDKDSLEMAYEQHVLQMAPPKTLTLSARPIDSKSTTASVVMTVEEAWLDLGTGRRLVKEFEGSIQKELEDSQRFEAYLKSLL